MTYVVAALLLAVMSNIVPNVAQANDYAPNVVQVMPEVRVCWSLQNIADFADRYLVVYDPSPEQSERIGTPWTLVQQGVCYDLSLDRDQFFYLLEKPVDSDVADVLTNPHNYPLTARLAEWLGEEPNTRFYDPFDTEPYYDYADISPRLPEVLESRRAFRLSARLQVDGWYLSDPESRALDTNIDLLELLPLRHVPEDGFSNHVVEYGQGLFEDSMRSFRDSVYAIQNGVEEAVGSCDERKAIRIPVTITMLPLTAKEGASTPISREVPTIESGAVYWELASGATIARPTDTYAAIEALGCTSEVQSYLKGAKDEIDALDDLLRLAAEKKPDAFVRRSDTEYAELVSYAYYGKTYPTEVEDVATELPVQQFTQDIGPTRLVEVGEQLSFGSSSTSSVVDHTTSNGPRPVFTQATTTDSRQDDDMSKIVLPESPSGLSRSFPFTLLYFVALPLVGALGLAYMVLRRKKPLDAVDVEGEGVQDDA